MRETSEKCSEWGLIFTFHISERRLDFASLAR